MRNNANGEVFSGCTAHFSASQIEISGIVQGVGFRPFVYQLARRYQLKGQVANTSAGVRIHVEGAQNHIDQFFSDLKSKAPPLAQLTRISRLPGQTGDFSDFSISPSENGTLRSTLISPDIGVCEDCRAEMYDPQDRRHGYAFINCTNCGPRYTIIDDIPYDRPNTSMKPFAMCEDCQAEYDDPGNRRFHAQPNACPVCGPKLQLLNNQRDELDASDPVQQTIELLKNGNIVAIKGLGGFHLAVDAENREAVARLRQRKHRAEKPFALMSRDTAAVRRYAQLNPDEKALLTSPQRPIVLLKKRAPSPIADMVAPENLYFGVMLPYTPLHYLLLAGDFTALVMTSANLSEEPIVIANEDAFEGLSGIADFFLNHNRDILLRSDDSILRHLAGATRFVRRSRGYVPAPLFLKRKLPPILACGAELKNTVCLTRDNQAFLSQHIGDLENNQAYEFFKQTISHVKRILDIEPAVIAYDMHPGYLSSRYALAQTDKTLVPVQHHHAHIVSCMAENGLDGDLIGLAFDGTGYGTDGRIWGGELLIASPAAFIRPAHLSYVPMPGGEAAIREPWRMGISYLIAAFGEAFESLDLPLLKAIDPEKVRVVRDMALKGINAPLTSSLGRLFDGVAAILGVRHHATFEGQAAMALETIAADCTNYLKASRLYDCELFTSDVCEISVASIISGIVRDWQNGLSPADISTRFHLSLIQIYSKLCDLIRYETGLNRVVLSGGAFQNAILLKGLMEGLRRKGFRVYTHRRLPPNDGGISLGQALAAAAMSDAI